MTVKELIKELEDYGDHVEVVLCFDGIDCEVSCVEFNMNTGQVVLES